MNISAYMDALEARAAERIKPEDGDYIGEDGLLYCGKCRTPKQTRIVIFGKEKTPMCTCKCMQERKEREEAARRHEEFLKDLTRKRQIFGFSEDDMQRCTFAADDGQNPYIANIARKYVDNFPQMLKEGKGLLFFGDTGVGKTFYASCIANALTEKGYPTMITNFSKLINLINGTFERKNAYIDDLNYFALIVIDDLATERNTETANEIVYNIIDSRVRSGLPLIITTNLTGAELQAPENVKNKRIYSRLYEICFPVEVEGADRRRAKLNTDFAEFHDMLGIVPKRKGAG